MKFLRQYLAICYFASSHSKLMSGSLKICHQNENILSDIYINWGCRIGLLCSLLFAIHNLFVCFLAVTASSLLVALFMITIVISMLQHISIISRTKSDFALGYFGCSTGLSVGRTLPLLKLWPSFELTIIWVCPFEKFQN